MEKFEGSGLEIDWLTLEGRRIKNFLAITIVVGFLLGMIITILALGSLLGVEPYTLLSQPANRLLGGTSSERLIAQGSVIDVAKKVQPSVVNIQSDSGGSSFSRLGKADSNTVGSGVVLREDGYILTNNHVVANAKRIQVTIDQETMRAQVLGADPETDIAVIRVDKTGLTVANFGTAQNLQVGELAVAIGSPFGFEHSVSAGVVSGLNRNVTVGAGLDRPRTYTNLIQTDASINPGNSGGALSNRQGQIVGINSLIYSTNGVSQGIGFAIPIDQAREVANQLIEKGEASHAFVGVSGETVDNQLMLRWNLKVRQGALVLTVFPKSPAAKLGLVRGDVVVAVDDDKITTIDDLVGAVRKRKPGATVNLQVNRDGNTLNLPVELSRKPRSATKAMN